MQNLLLSFYFVLGSPQCSALPDRLPLLRAYRKKWIFLAIENIQQSVAFNKPYLQNTELRLVPELLGVYLRTL